MASDDRPVAFVDSSAIVALVDEDDAAHSAAVDAYRELSTSGYRLFTTDHVVVEAYDLLLNGVGPVVATAWLRDQRLPVYCTDEADLAAAQTILAARPADAPVSFTDALSLAVMERLGVADAFAVDPAFLNALS
ncbi:MAG TPA: PIN domain-containing protein [Thermomicrobiales bacterium]|jgi:predicted nucleic acid-binding protein|nr:PIN domain-containing protein [Thermomicrobiales bacterium]